MTQIKMFCDGVTVEDTAMKQLNNVAAMPFIYKHLAVMPDVHAGIGATVGSVIPTQGAIIPAAVGVDIGCGMCAVRLSITANDLPDNLHFLRTEIEAAIPHGRTDNGGMNDKGTWNESSPLAIDTWSRLHRRYEQIVEKHPKIKSHKTHEFMGTLGTGNHFIEICLDEEDHVWIMLHSGSRGIGNKIGTYFIEKAKEEMRRYYIDKFLPDQDLAYLVEYTELFDDYIDAVHFAQEFASLNRDVMMQSVIDVMRRHFTFEIINVAINCHHNYTAKENHFGKNVWVTRKGAVRARTTDYGIIPGSMGTGSYIVKGKSNPHSFCSCSHGAGRRMSRMAAKRTISLEDHIIATEGIECRKDVDVIDESPAAYKDINAVMAAQTDLIEVVHRLRQVVNVKG